MKAVRRIVTVVTLAFVMTAFLAPSQAAYADTTTEHNSLKADAWALQFQVNPNFTLGAYKGTILSLKKHTSDGRAWRVGVSADFDFGDRDTERRHDNEPVVPYRDYDNEAYSFDLTAQRLWYASPTETVTFFHGLGLLGGWGWSKSGQQDPAYPEYGNSYERTMSSWRLGGSGVVGFEWFVKPRISLVGEYEGGLVYRSSTNKDYRKHKGSNGSPDHESEDTSDTTSFSFDHNEVRLGLSVYF